MRWTIWRGVIGGVVLNLLVGLLLLGVMPLEYWSYEHGVHGSLWEFGPGLRWGYKATGPSLRDHYLSGFIHLGGLGCFFGGPIDYKQRKKEALNTLGKFLPLFLGLGLYFHITGPLYMLCVVGLMVGSLIYSPKYIAEEMGGSELYPYLSPLHLLGSRVPYFLFLGCLIFGVFFYLLTFSALEESTKRLIIIMLFLLGLIVGFLVGSDKVLVIILVLIFTLPPLVVFVLAINVLIYILLTHFINDEEVSQIE